MSKTDRLVNLLCLMTQKPGLTVKEMAQQMDTTERTIYRYLRDLRENGYELYQEEDPRSSLQRYSIAPLKLTGSEAVALVNTCRPYLKQKGLPLSRDLESAIEKIKAAICRREEIEHFQKMKSAYTFMTPVMRDHSPWEEIIQTIEESIKEECTLNAFYDAFSSDVSRNRPLDPYQLFWQGGNLYLVAYCHRKQEVRTFRVDRFISVNKTSRKFSQAEDFDLESYLGSSWKVYRGVEEIELKILVYPPASRFFKESTYHPSQQICELQDGILECTFQVSNTPELRGWLLSWGSKITIQHPPELKEEIKEELKHSLNNY